MDEEDQELIRGTVDQAAAALGNAGLDCWLVFCRETSEIPEPARIGSAEPVVTALRSSKTDDGARSLHEPQTELRVLPV